MENFRSLLRLSLLVLFTGILAFNTSPVAAISPSSSPGTLAITMHSTFNDMPLAIREQSISILAVLLANAVDLHSHLKQAHWVIRGPGFISLHELFDKVAKEVLDYADMIAERIEQLGGNVQGTLYSAVQLTSLPRYPTDAISPPEQLKALSLSMSCMAKLVRPSIDVLAVKDTVTAEILTDFARSLDKNLWFIESNLKPSSIPA